jgi:hypothetical protein
MTDRRTFMSSMMRAGVALPALRGSAFATLFRAEDLVLGKAPEAAASDEAYGRRSRWPSTTTAPSST